MLTKNGNHITLTDAYRTKYASAIAEYLDELGMDGGADHDGGDVECPSGYFMRFGKRVLRCDDRGFMWVETFMEARGAEQYCDALEGLYSEWDYEEWMEEDELDSDEHQSRMIACEEYCQYVYSCAMEDLEAHSYRMWVVCGRPISYLGKSRN